MGTPEMLTIKTVMRYCALIFSLTIAPPSAMASDIEARSVLLPTSLGPVSAEHYMASGKNSRPAVIILHGMQGIDPFRSFYQHYAAVIARSGIDAYLLSYYTGDDAQQARNPIAEKRHAYFGKQVRVWSKLVSDVVGDILADSSGRIGLLGFSQGGFLATAAAGQDARISAMTVFYGGIPNGLKDEITHLPPLLELHGDADRRVPLAEGNALVDLAHGLDSPAERVVYPGAGHGFSGANATDAERRTVAFFQRWLLAR
jgi:carboxymethylenebutenolidase